MNNILSKEGKIEISIIPRPIIGPKTDPILPDPNPQEKLLNVLRIYTKYISLDYLNKLISDFYNEQYSYSDNYANIITIVKRECYLILQNKYNKYFIIDNNKFNTIIDKYTTNINLSEDDLFQELQKMEQEPEPKPDPQKPFEVNSTVLIAGVLLFAGWALKK